MRTMFRAIHFSVVMTLFSLFTKAQSGEYAIQFSYDAAGRVIERKATVMVSGRIGRTPVDSLEVSPSPSFKVFPNPTNDYINIEGELPEKSSLAKFALMNTSGQSVAQGIYKGSPMSLSVQGLARGVYVLQFKYADKTQTTYKLIVN
jgi:hypothetical protein